MSRVDVERAFWANAAADRDVRNQWICDAEIEDGPCVDLVAGVLADAEVAVEIGCGIGRLTAPLADRFPWVRFHGFDISAGMLAQAPTRGNVCYEVCDGRSVPLPDGSADTVYTMLVFQHLPAEGVHGYIAEAGRVLVPGGLFLCQFIEGVECEPFSHHYPLSDVVGWVEAAGMEPVGLDMGLIDPNWTWLRARRV